MKVLRLASVVDWPGYSRAVRHLLAEGVAPDAVRWQVGEEPGGDLFESGEAEAADALPEAPMVKLPRSFVESAHEVFLHADADRFALLHRLSARIAADARAWADPLDADRLRFDRALHEVRREIHKMHAFVRFRPLPDAGGERHVAWFEPAHHVVEQAAGFFARRFATMRWALLTPRVSVEWDGGALAFGPGAPRSAAPAADAGEALWLDYYRSIFNPARVKLGMMKKEMPVRFWKNLPEAAAIAPLVAQAAAREAHMVAERAQPLRRRTSSALHAGEPAPAGGLEGLRRRVAACRECPVADCATQAVFGEGDPAAGLMVVGEQPGDEEDLRGRPFQGPAGRLLRAAFDELGWDVSRLWITNAVKHFHHELRGKRRLHKTPGQREIEACRAWLEGEIEAVRPRAIVALGATAARSLLGREIAVTANEGRWIERADGLPVLIGRHPAAILRADAARREAMRTGWIDSLRPASEFARGLAPA